MESAQLFTGLLLAIGAIHLVFSAVDAVDRWLLKNRRSPAIVAKGQKLSARPGWYVFFNPADLCGKQEPAIRNQPLLQSTVSRNQRPRPRATARF